jgi:hypothetical protein
MALVTLTNDDLTRLSSHYAHLTDLDFSSLVALRKSIHLATGERTYKVSDSISFSHGYVDGMDSVFIVGRGRAISEALGKCD